MKSVEFKLLYVSINVHVLFISVKNYVPINVQVFVCKFVMVCVSEGKCFKLQRDF